MSNLLRLQSFDGAKLNPAKQYAYKMDKPEGEAEGQIYAMGVPAICALPDGRLLVMEREFFVSPGILDTWVKNKLFITDPGGSRDVTAVADLRTLDDGTFLDKTLVWEHKTELLSATGNELANFEGMCLGPELADGSHTLILVNDAQSGVIPLMKEYFMVLKITY